LRFLLGDVIQLTSDIFYQPAGRRKGHIMIKIVITSPEVRNMAGIGKISGKPYDMNFQTGYAFTVSADGVLADFPDKFEFVLGKDQKPYERGSYTLAPSAAYVDRDGHLSIKTRLVAVPAAK